MGFSGRKRMLRRRLAGVVVALTLVPSTSGAYDHPRKSFYAYTEGSPVASIRGEWNDEEDPATVSNTARLNLDGGHGPGRYTRFEGRWVAPASTSSKQPKMSIAHELTFSNQLGPEVRLVQAIRARFPGGRWGKWVRNRVTLPASQSGTSADAFQVVVPLEKARRVIFQWKVVGKIGAPAALSGEFRLSVS